MKKSISFLVAAVVLLASFPLAPRCAAAGEPLKILAIGNSFSTDALEYFVPIAKSAGYAKTVVGNLYIGGCTLETHVKNALSGSADYTYYKSSGDLVLTSKENASLLDGLTDEDWDIITMQQGSALSGKAETYEPYLTQLVDFVNTNKTNPDARLAWHMTWAYQSDSDHGAFPSYSCDQMEMYNAILSAVETVVVPSGYFDCIIPVGTAIQNLRTSFLGDTITRDGYHLSRLVGRVTAAMTWAAALLEIDVSRVKTGIVTLAELTAAKQAVRDAVETPYGVSTSPYDTYTSVSADLNFFQNVRIYIEYLFFYIKMFFMRVF